MKVSILKKTAALATLLIAAYTLPSHAQQATGVGIGTTQPDNSAILDLSATDKGFLLPRMTLDERLNIKTPAKGLMIYQTNLLGGVYVYNGEQWQAVSGSATEAKLIGSDNTVWSTTGNAGLNSGVHYIGTTDTTSLVFKVNDVKSGIIDYKRGNTILGYKAASNANTYNSVIMGSLSLQRQNAVGNTVALGFQSLFSHESGDHNIAVGSGSLAANLTGEKNTVIGSLSGYKSQGSRNVFIGYQSGYFEQGSDKLHITNDGAKTSLIYGDFATAKLGINTTQLGNTLNINSGVANNSGLRFEKLNSASEAANGNSKVLSVDANGDVVLVKDLTGVNYWTLTGNNMSNVNPGELIINNGLTVNKALTVNEKITASNIITGSISANSFSGESMSAASLTTTTANVSRMNFVGLNSNSAVQAGNGKVLSLDETGRVILVNDVVGTTTTTTTPTNTGTTVVQDANWQINAEGKLENTNNSDVNIKTNLNAYGVSTYLFNVGWGGIRFKELNYNTTAFDSNGKCLSLDPFGNVILTNLPAGGTTTNVVTNNTASYWSLNNNVVYSNAGSKVVIGDVGTALPEGYSLYVRKGILAERVRVAIHGTDKWADYVFADNYKLMPLNKVEEFVKKEKHLPNVNSAETIAKDGIDIAEMAAKHMEKIEELTLYLIEYHKRVEKLEAKIAELEKAQKK